MKVAISIALRSVSRIESASGRRVRRRGLFARIVEALQLSRRRQARRLVGHYSHLIVEDFQDRPASTSSPHFKNEKESRRNANQDKSLVRTDNRTFERA
jgi:hypothetical protein